MPDALSGEISMELTLFNWSFRLVTMKIPAAEFKARCLAILDKVYQDGETVTITKRGRVVARLIPAGDETERPWEAMRGKARWAGDPFAPVVSEAEIDALAR
jgi:prevent-host-death family protein